MKGYTVQVSNVSSRATVKDIQRFFSFSGRITNINLRSDGQWSQVAFVTFKEADALDTAVLLSGSTIVDQPVSIVSLEEVDQEVGWEADAVLPVAAHSKPGQSVTKAQDMVVDMISKGYALGKDVLIKAKSFDEKHQFIANTSSRVVSIKQGTGLSDRLVAGATMVNKHVQAVDAKLRITERSLSALGCAQQGAITAGSAMANNKLVQTGGMWVSGAFWKLAKVAGDVTSSFKERMGPSEAPKLRARA